MAVAKGRVSSPQFGPVNETCSGSWLELANIHGDLNLRRYL